MKKENLKPIHVIGGGLAGSEACWQIARHGHPVILHEMRSIRKTEAHQTDKFAELVCSNSFRSDDKDYNAVGLLHEEMRLCNSLIMQAADENSVPAGSALAVDREHFSEYVTKTLEDHPLIDIRREEVTEIPTDGTALCVIATGPLTSTSLATSLKKITGEESLAFFDAIAPIVYTESIDFEKVWYQSRYDKPGPDGDGKDYINCPLNKEQYENFIDALIEGQKTEFKEWEKDTPYFEGCLPIEVMAERGRETLRYGPLKPVGLTNPHKEEKPYAVIQLRQDNALATLYNIVGFQTKLKYAAQKEIFKQIPGLENAEFARLGGIHRNTFLNSPLCLDEELRLKNALHIRMAGQVTGVEGYVESAATGLIAGLLALHESLGKNMSSLPLTTSLGALIGHITKQADAETFQPMNVNFGLFPPILQESGKRIKGRDRKKKMTERASIDFQKWKNSVFCELTDQSLLLKHTG